MDSSERKINVKVKSCQTKLSPAAYSDAQSQMAEDDVSIRSGSIFALQ